MDYHCSSKFYVKHCLLGKLLVCRATPSSINEACNHLEMVVCIATADAASVLPPSPFPPLSLAGLYSPSFTAALQHLGDVVVSLETLADDSDVYQLLPDPAR